MATISIKEKLGEINMIEKLKQTVITTRDNEVCMALSDKQILEKINEIIETVNYLEKVVDNLQSRHMLIGDR